MVDKAGRPWVIAVLAAYAVLAVVVMVFARSPWNWILALLIVGKGAGFYFLILRIATLGVRHHVRSSVPKEEVKTVRSGV